MGVSPNFLASPDSSGVVQFAPLAHWRGLVSMDMPLRSTTSLLLAAMLLGATFAPPAIRHAHLPSEGDISHSRGADHHHSHRHDAHDASPIPSADPSLHFADVLGGHWWHLHFHLLGIDFTFPEPGSGGNDGESPENLNVLTLAAGQQWLPSHSVRLNWIEDLVPPSASSSLGDAAPMQVVVFTPPPVSSAPLCDTARRERSGVLLV